MTIDNDVLQTIVDALKGIHLELKILNEQKAKTAKPEGPTRTYGRTQYAPPSRSGPSRSGPPKFGPSASESRGESRGPRFKKTDKPPRKTR